MAGTSVARREIDKQELMRRLLAKYTLRECADFFGVAYPTMCARARRSDFLEELKELNSTLYEDVDRELSAHHHSISARVIEMSNKALDRLEEMLDDDSTDARIMVKVAQDLLDRNPEASKSTKSLVKTEHTFMNPLTLKAAALAAQEMDESVVGRVIEAQ